ncbi:arginine-tRNA-protein transferase [Crucibulum laeve]|uniref:Arginyl-tRNA--protein transferase 1 n=1 Tax=Crucibulum laeve TaxID=68775 RepID=A0A5C3MI82_9AGAR|nr:arginine-tRNA-protein transferase [Crucibulum laeve]
MDVFLSCCDQVYQRMIDRGWRRSGSWCYKPELKTSCCPQYTIKLDAMEFKPSKSQRKLINRWNRFVLSGKTGEAMDVDAARKNTSSEPRNSHTFSLTDSIHASEIGFHSSDEHLTHTFETILEPSSYTPEKFALFEKYQKEIHHDKSTPSGFKRFLVDSPLVEEPISYSSSSPDYLPHNYGSYHQLYKLDGQLIAMAVLDILPNCVSSVYFMYDKTWEGFSLGKLSALREISLAHEIRQAGALEMGYLYMGFYIYSCQKMRYKGDYSPSYLADPETYEWYPLDKCIPLLEKYRYACFSEPTHCIEEAVRNNDDNSSHSELDDSDLTNIRMITMTQTGGVQAIAITSSPYWAYEDVRSEFGACIRGLGLDLAKDIVFDF